MDLKNRFSRETRAIWCFNYACDICGRNNNLEHHHILSTISDSPLNCAQLCHTDHTRVNNGGDKIKSMLLKKTMSYLLKQGYKLTAKDVEFYKQNQRLYDL